VVMVLTDLCAPLRVLKCYDEELFAPALGMRDAGESLALCKHSSLLWEHTFLLAMRKIKSCHSSLVTLGVSSHEYLMAAVSSKNTKNGVLTQGGRMKTRDSGVVHLAGSAHLFPD
jgi:hypothetical protein